jgi:hypothetical protein
MPWQPVLQGDLRQRAGVSVRAILDDLTQPGKDSADEFSLAGGIAGQAILHGYVGQSELVAGNAAIAAGLLQRALAHAAGHPGPASLYSGLTGVGWATTHLAGRLPGLDGEEDVAEIDETLCDHLQQTPWPDDYDLINGLVGFGVYALERLPRPTAAACLERVVGHLAAIAEHREDGCTWWTNPAWLPAQYRTRSPHGYYNLGLAHGVPGVIALLGWACRAGAASTRARPMLDGAVRWLLKQQGPDGFGYWVGPDGVQDRARLAWCYGDPGVAAALLAAARCVGEPAWECEALAIARRAARRPAEQSGVVDAGLCHGAAGLGHTFNRMYQATGEAWLAEAARSWFARALELRQPGRGIGGYAEWQPSGDSVQTWVAEKGLLTGAAGIALALLAATTAVEPAWDRMLLVAIPTVINPSA